MPVGYENLFSVNGVAGNVLSWAWTTFTAAPDRQAATMKALKRETERAAEDMSRMSQKGVFFIEKAGVCDEEGGRKEEVRIGIVCAFSIDRFKRRYNVPPVTVTTVSAQCLGSSKLLNVNV